MASAARVELSSGIWSGYYEQHGREHAQRMVLEFADGLMRGDGVDGIGAFRIAGEYRVEGSEVRMGWIKTYEDAHSVLYLGALARGVITGRWSLTGASGAFGLRPPHASEATAGGRAR